MRINNLTNTNIEADMRENHVLNFYERYLGHLELHSNKEDCNFYAADSPFNNGEIIVSAFGGWYEESTGYRGDMTDFLSKMFPLVTKLGYLQTIQSEYLDVKANFPDLERNISLNQRLTIAKHLRANDATGRGSKIGNFEIDNFTISDFGFMNYFEYPANVGDIINEEFDITINGNFINSSYAFVFIDFIHGVQKLKEHSDKECIYFVENPMQLVKVSDETDDPVYIRPSGESYFHHDYDKLLDGKKVILLKKTSPGPIRANELSRVEYNSDQTVDLFGFYEEDKPAEINRNDIVDLQEIIIEFSMQTLSMEYHINS